MAHFFQGVIAIALIGLVFFLALTDNPNSYTNRLTNWSVSQEDAHINCKWKTPCMDAWDAKNPRPKIEEGA